MGKELHSSDICHYTVRGDRKTYYGHRQITFPVPDPNLHLFVSVLKFYLVTRRVFYPENKNFLVTYENSLLFFIIQTYDLPFQTTKDRLKQEAWNKHKPCGHDLGRRSVPVPGVRHLSNRPDVLLLTSEKLFRRCTNSTIKDSLCLRETSLSGHKQDSSRTLNPWLSDSETPFYTPDPYKRIVVE